MGRKVLRIMGLRDDDPSIYSDRNLLEWAKQAPTSSGDYDHAPSEEEAVALEYERRKWLERKPRNPSGYDEGGR